MAVAGKARAMPSTCVRTSPSGATSATAPAPSAWRVLLRKIGGTLRRPVEICIATRLGQQSVAKTRHIDAARIDRAQPTAAARAAMAAAEARCKEALAACHWFTGLGDLPAYAAIRTVQLMAGGKIDEVENHVIRSIRLCSSPDDRFALETTTRPATRR